MIVTKLNKLNVSSRKQYEVVFFSVSFFYSFFFQVRVLVRWRQAMLEHSDTKDPILKSSCFQREVQSSVVKRIPIHHDIAYSTFVTEAEHKVDIVFTTDTPWLTLTGKLWGVYWEEFGENWQRYKRTVLKHPIFLGIITRLTFEGVSYQNV